MKAVLSLFALSLIATGLIGLLTMVLTSAAPTLPLRVLAVIGAVLGVMCWCNRCSTGSHADWCSGADPCLPRTKSGPHGRIFMSVSGRWK